MRRGAVGTALAQTALAGVAVFMLVPFLYMLGTALQGGTEPPLGVSAWLPADPQYANFAVALAALPFRSLFINSAVVASGVVLGQVLTGAAAAYAFARLRFPGRDRLFLGVLSLGLVPAVALAVSRYVLVDALGWVDHYAGLISTELVSVWGIFLLRQSFRAVPSQLEEAARLDGAGEWAIFWRVALPLARPALGAFAVVAFADAWRNFLWPLVVTRTVNARVVEVGLAGFPTLAGPTWPVIMAAAAIVSAPLVVLALLLQRRFVRGLELRAVWEPPAAGR
ncbi:MAG TPA: carbohydrate ABC transporter permease [Gemmatimonadales bacterium]